MYNPSNPKHKKAKEQLLETVWAKTNYWASEVAARLEGFECSAPRMWSKPGFAGVEGKKKRVSKFKEYTCKLVE